MHVDIKERGNEARRSTKAQLEGRETSQSVDSVHELELNVWQSGNPTVLLMGDVVSQYLNDHAVGAFAGAVCFGVVHRGEFNLDPSETVQGFPETRHKKLVTVRNDVHGQAIFAVPVHKEQRSKIFSGDVGTTRYKTYVGTKAACHGRNTVKTFVIGKPSHEIDGNTFTTAVRHGQGVERTDRFNIKCLVPLTGIARQDVEVLEVTAEVQPVIRIAQRSIRLVEPKVSERIMCETEEAFADMRDARDDKSATNEQQAILDRYPSR